MPSYKEMYKIMFRAQTKAIQILQEAQQQAEDIYINEEEIKIIEIKNCEKDESK